MATGDDNDILQDIRLGDTVPRSILCPPYLKNNPYYEAWVDQIDTVWSTMVDPKIRALGDLRNMWVTNPQLEQKVVDQQMIEITDWDIPERKILVQQVNLLGMQLASAGVLTDQNFLLISRFLGLYWFGKGTQAFIEFMNFCCGLDLEIKNLWSQNDLVSANQYHNLTEEDDEGNPPGTPIWEGGTWFPTTHVNITATGGLTPIALTSISTFFYEIANYNLVLNSIESSYEMMITDGLGDTDATRIVAVALYVDHELVISNTGQYGATPPPTGDEGPPMGTSYWTTGTPDVAQDYALTDPQSWFLMSPNYGTFTSSTNPDLGADGTGFAFDPTFPFTDDRKAYAVYTEQQESTINSDTIPSKVMGHYTTGTDDALNVLILGPVQWMAVPGAGTNSEGVIPVFNALPTKVTGSQYMATSTVGQRTAFLVNPRGWDEVSPGLWTPYW